MKIQLPLENWSDLLPLVPRRQLVQLLFQLNDRQFAKILQFFLTEVGQITLGYLRIVAPRKNDPNGCGPIVEVRKKMLPFWSESQAPPPIDLKTNLPEGPMPTNVKDFKQIELSYFDMSVANFVCQFQQAEPPGNFRLDNVNLWIPSLLHVNTNTIIMPILTQLMPMIGNINSMFIWHLHPMGFGCVGLELGPNNAASQLLTTMLTKTRILEIYFPMHTSTFPWCEWLYALRNDGKPRALRLSGSFPDTINLIEQIKTDFSKATRPVCFFVYVQAYKEFGRRNDRWQDICLDNGQTNERLVVKTIDPPPGDPLHVEFDPEKHALISRYHIGANQEWIESNEQEIVEWNFDEQNSRIRFGESLTNCDTV